MGAAARRVQGPRGARDESLARARRAPDRGAAGARRSPRSPARSASGGARTGCSASPIATAAASRSSPIRPNDSSRSAPTASGSRSDAVREWDPPHRLVFGWRQAGFPDDRSTEVAVRFDAVDTGTRVTVEHFGWDAIPQEHAARHGFPLAGVPATGRRVVAGPAAVAARPRHVVNDAPPPSVARWTQPAPANTSSRRHRRDRRRRAHGPTGTGAEPRGAMSHAGAGRAARRALDPRRRPRRLPVRFGGQLRARRRRRPAVLRQPHGRAHPERAARPARQPARHRTGARGRRSARQRAGHPARPARTGRRRRPRPGPGAVPRREPGGVVLHRLRRLHLPAARRRPRSLRGWLRAHELGRRRRLPRRVTRSAGRRGGGDHRAHERRTTPTRRCCSAGTSPHLPDTTSASMSAVDRYGFDMVAVSAEHRTPVRLAFPDECTTGDEVRRAMVAMVAEARSRRRLTLGVSWWTRRRTPDATPAASPP